MEEEETTEAEAEADADAAIASDQSPSGSIILESSQVTVTTGGAEMATLTATVTGNDGQPVAIGTSVTFSTSEGTFANGERTYTTTTADDSGTVQTRLYPDEGNVIATVLCTSGDLSETIAVGFEDY